MCLCCLALNLLIALLKRWYFFLAHMFLVIQFLISHQNLCSNFRPDIRKTSSIIFLSAHKHMAAGNSLFRSEVNSRIKKYIDKHNWPANIARLILHIWVIPIYGLIYYTGAFGFYYSRVSREVLHLCRRNFQKIHGRVFTIGLNSKWFKPLETLGYEPLSYCNV